MNSIFKHDDFTNDDYDIRILCNNEWLCALNHQKEAFITFIQSNRYIHNSIYNYVFDNMNITIRRGINSSDDDNIELCYQPIYLIYNDEYYPIFDFSSIKVFLVDQEPVNWYRAKTYQSWAYLDFLYSEYESITYASVGSETQSLNGMIRFIPIYFCNIPNIVFRISRNENGSIFYEKNNNERTRIRMSDSLFVMRQYLGYYKRLTEFEPIINQIICNKTVDEERQCIICNENEKNIILNPCNHNIICYECYENLKSNTCPICRKEIIDFATFLP
jgi:hypothetical protein